MSDDEGAEFVVTFSFPQEQLAEAGIHSEDALDSAIGELALTQCPECHALIFVPPGGGYCPHCSYGVHIDVAVTHGTVFDHAAELAERLESLEAKAEIPDPNGEENNDA